MATRATRSISSSSASIEASAATREASVTESGMAADRAAFSTAAGPTA